MTLTAKRTSVIPYQPVEFSITIANGSAAPIGPLDRAELAGARNLVVAGQPDPTGVRKGRWATIVQAATDGRIGPLLPGESFTLPFKAAIPDDLAEQGLPVVFQWVGSKDALPGIRSNEVPITLQPGQDPIVTLETSEGTIVLELWPAKAPNHVANFVALAQAGFYDGKIFHRVVPNFVVQTGSPDGTGSGGPGYTIPAEFNDVDFKKGILGMARAQTPDSAGSQFFICVADAPSLTRNYTAFGRVLEGQEVADRISFAPAKAERPVKDVQLKRVLVDLPRGYVPSAVKKTGEDQK